MPRKAARQKNTATDTKAELKQVHETILKMFRAALNLHTTAHHEKMFWASGMAERLFPVLKEFLATRSSFRTLSKRLEWRAYDALQEASLGFVVDRGPRGAGSATEFAVLYADFIEFTVGRFAEDPERIIRDISPITVELVPGQPLPPRTIAGSLVDCLSAMKPPNTDVEGLMKKEYYDALRRVDRTLASELTRKPDVVSSDGADDSGNWITVSDAARLVGVDTGTISRAATKGQLKHNGKVKAERRVYLPSVQQWHKRRLSKPEQRESDEHVQNLLSKAARKR